MAEPKPGTVRYTLEIFAIALCVLVIGIATKKAEPAPTETIAPDACIAACAPAALWVWAPDRCECEPTP